LRMPCSEGVTWCKVLWQGKEKNHFFLRYHAAISKNGMSLFCSFHFPKCPVNCYAL
jgi:hypothetical protein